jgi:hypothetical protein
MYNNMKEKVTRNLKAEGLHEKHVVATRKLGNHLSIRIKIQLYRRMYPALVTLKNENMLSLVLFFVYFLGDSLVFILVFF